MPGPLAGFRVVDLSAVVSGPLTGALLADQGADVIKVERTGEGDIQRNVGSKRNGFFHVLNRGKRSLAADLILQGDGVDERPPVGASGTMLEFADGWGASMTLSQNEFDGMCRAYGLDHIACDPRFSTLAARGENRRELREILSEEVTRVTRALSVEEAGARLAAEQVPFARVRRLAELHEDAQVRHNEVFRELDHPVAGRLRDARPAPRFSATPVEPGGPAPTVGQHTREILTEIGLAAELGDYFERGIVS